MKKFLLLSAAVLSGLISAQNFIQAYQNRADQVSQTNINSSLQEFVNFGVKSTGSVANNNAFNWLKSKYLGMGFSADQLQENAFTYNSSTSKNLIVTKTGTTYPNIFVIVCGHFDTVGGVGANDNGSGTTAILEIARILKDVPTEYSIKFIHFSGEEQGLIGSKNYVNTVVNATSPKMNIRVVFNLDQIGGRAGQTNNSIVCERDTGSPASNNAASDAKTQELMNCVSLYSNLTPSLSYAYASDYMPFEDNGEIITGFYEQNGASNPNPHGSSDVISNMDSVYLAEVTKAAVGATQHFAVATETILATNSELAGTNFTVYPNPAKETLYLQLSKNDKTDFIFTVVDITGKTVLTVKNQTSIDISKLQPGIYLVTLLQNGIKSTRKIIVGK